MEINTVLKLFSTLNMRIPNYQRAFSWEKKQTEDFLGDLEEQVTLKNSKYYFGHFILESSDEKNFDIIDGQQRLTIIMLFISACKRLDKTINHELFKYANSLKVTDYDQQEFNELKNIGKINNIKTLSQKKMQEAVIIFDKFIENNKASLNKYLDIISNSFVSIAKYESKAIAAQIFELHNTRGIELTETEKIKAYLMKQLYLMDDNSEQDVKKLQEYFSDIYLYEQTANKHWIKGDLAIDEIFFHHLRAVDDGNKNDSYDSPSNTNGDDGIFVYVKNKITKFEDNKDLIKNYVLSMSKEFSYTMNIITHKLPEYDRNNNIVGDILFLDKNKSMIFLLRLLRSDFNPNHKIFKKWEVFLFCYEFLELFGHFYRTWYRYRGDFELIYREIKNEKSIDSISVVVQEYFTGKRKFAYQLDNEKESLAKYAKSYFSKKDTGEWFLTNVYNDSWKYISYILYKYEVSHVPKNLNKIRKNIIKSNAISLDHIIAHESEEADNVQEVINGIGNLAPLTISDNAKAGNSGYISHAEIYEKKGLEHTAQTVKKWKKYSLKNCVEKRGREILDFVQKYFIENDTLWCE